MINLHFRSYITMLIVMLLAVVDSTRAEILFADSFELLAPLATRQLDVNPRTILLTTTGESYQLEVGVFDMDENPVSAPVSFRSTRPEVVSVSATGEVTALGPVGSAKVIVATDGALNVAVLVMVADPVEGALVINDEQVESGPELVDPEAELAPGMEIRLVISGINPANTGNSDRRHGRSSGRRACAIGHTGCWRRRGGPASSSQRGAVRRIRSQRNAVCG